MPKTYVHKATGGIKFGGGARIEFRRRNTKKGRRYSLETVEGMEKRRDGSGRFVEVRRTIDRENDRYIERIVDSDTGEVLREVDEPLSQHLNRGTHRQKKKVK